MNKALSLCLGVLLAIGFGLVDAAIDSPQIRSSARTHEGATLLAQHFGHRPDELFAPTNVHGGDYSDSVDPNPDMPNEPENVRTSSRGPVSPTLPGRGAWGHLT